jgi:hypothetical protein
MANANESSHGKIDAEYQSELVMKNYRKTETTVATE